MHVIPNVFLVGPMGAGKSTIGRLLAADLHREFCDSDHVIEDRCGASIPWIFDVEGESGFREREQAVIDELTSLREVVMATGGGAIMAEANRRVLRERGTVVYLYAPVEQQLKRAGRDRNRPLLQQDDPGRVLKRLFELRDPLYRETADIIVRTDRRSPRAVTNEIRRRIKSLADPLHAPG
ncbi:shikimate kinase AroK [Halomonas sp. GDM18]|nr:shikimate kinase AroK [Halomonas sp. GDM18]